MTRTSGGGTSRSWKQALRAARLASYRSAHGRDGHGREASVSQRSGGDLIGVRSGSGRPPLVLHGGPATNDSRDWFAAELAGWDALRYTRRGVDLTKESAIAQAVVGHETAHWVPSLGRLSGYRAAPIDQIWCAASGILNEPSAVRS
jgi:hypothetical protein